VLVCEDSGVRCNCAATERYPQAHAQGGGSYVGRGEARATTPGKVAEKSSALPSSRRKSGRAGMTGIGRLSRVNGFDRSKSPSAGPHRLTDWVAS
jgi:hypothetical protein